MKRFEKTIVVIWTTLIFFSGFNLYSQKEFPLETNKSTTDTLKLCFISDTQEPLIFERIFLKYNHNKNARGRIFNEILETSPASVFHLGDLVSIGFWQGTWKEIDEFANTLSRRNISFNPIPGNHEYLLLSKLSISQFEKRYHYAKLTGYTKCFKNIAVVLFNSNFNNLSEDDLRKQLSWYKKTIAEYENDSSIDLIIVGCHNSPFTNSKIVSPSEEVQKYFLPTFYASKKCKLFLSGHAHAFEHFKINGKDFLVIGGGGGIQQPLHVSYDQKYEDLYSKTLVKRMFHFITIKAAGEKIFVELNMLKENFKEFSQTIQLTY